MIAVYVVLFFALVFSSISAVKVTTSLGDISGVPLKSRLGADFYAFRGIRYAKPPVGALRFQSPQPVDPWKPKTFDATDDGPMCPQPVKNPSDYSEDCLLLNVYSKDLSVNASKPVIVYLHPGGFYGFSGQSKNNAGPQLLMDRNIVFVSINYRLASLGFLATGTADAPGNAAMKDQVLALKWVRDHIMNFGGNPQSVTLLGYSAGSMSVGLHMVSPMAKGLFHRGIAMSASPITQTKYETNQLDLAKRQAELVKCPTDTMDAMMKCLRETPVKEFVDTFKFMFDFGYNPMLNWWPVIEKDFGQERYITEDPEESYKAGRFQRTPLIIGRTKDEFVRIAYYTLKNENMTNQMNNNWEIVAPILLQYERNTPKSHEISATLRKRYLGDQTLSSTGPFEPLGKLYSDGIIGFGVHRFAHLASRFVPVYYYRFSYSGCCSDFKYPGDRAYGAVHHDDLLYFLHIPRLAPLFKRTDPEDKTVQRLTRMWATFAYTGNPKPPNCGHLTGFDWEPFTWKKEGYLDIGEELEWKPTSSEENENYKTWDQLFPMDWSKNHCKKDSGNKFYPDPEEESPHKST